MTSPTITVSFDPADVAALSRCINLWPISEPAPSGFFEMQEKIGQAILTNPEFAAALKALVDGQ